MGDATPLGAVILLAIERHQVATICAIPDVAKGQQVTNRLLVIIRQLTIQQRAALRGGLLSFAALGQSTPVDVITLRRIVSSLRRSITPIAKGEAEVATEVVEAVAEVEAIEAIEEVQFDAIEEFAVGFARTVRRMQPWRTVFYKAFDLNVII